MDRRTIESWARLVRVSQDLLSKVESALRAAGHPPLSWYDVLLEVNRADPSPVRAGLLQERLLLRQYNLSRILDRIEKAGLIASQPAADDRRARDLTITDAGRACLKDMWPIYRGAIDRHFASALTQAEARQLGDLLMKLQRK